MGPGEAIAAVALFIGAPWAVLTGIAKIKAAGRSGPSSSQGTSEIRKSELEAIIATSVEEATAGLQRRVEMLEAIVTDEDEALDRIDPAVLAGVLDPTEADEFERERRRERT